MIINREDTERRKSESYHSINNAKLAAEILMSFQQFFSGRWGSIRAMTHKPAYFYLNISRLLSAESETYHLNFK